MTYRLTGAAWGLIVTAVLVTVPLSLRDRLPEPLATHWSDRPDNSAPFTAHLVITLLLWLLPWALLMGIALRGRALERRLGRGYWWGFLFAWGLFSIGVEVSTLYANLDRASWQEAELPGWTVLAVLGASAAAGVIAGALGRGEPDQAPPARERAPRLRLRPGQRSVWVSRLGNPWLLALTAISAVALVVTIAVGLVLGLPANVWASMAFAFLIAAVSGAMTGTISVRVTEDGVAVGFGPFGWPVRRIRLSAIDRAWSEPRYPSQVGGWGLRGVPGSATLMLRGGDCLVIRYKSGGQFVISIDDAERGASLINGLIEERVA
ncbi:hypothetical protein HNP84_000310 [Thermocatellispora tengchongensis]|uniref:DUF1648 domain-containing protein n=1 Tax=Thermocatellispora tengchongensis TaxID=1073253 RepID=A0A840NTP0_9ACTN|nr:DUF1648 domain-containing protein [Thermocatellispora tengchongensis]MBB5130622.1 hypothetical protein [Thermocatellispora tengchongensis]